MRKNTIISLCDYSGVWSAPYKEAGYDVIQVDLKIDWGDARLWPTHGTDPEGVVHREGRYSSDLADVRDYIGRVQGVLAAPVCTVFSNAGAKHPRTDAELLEGLSLVDACIRIAWVLKPAWWVLENPVGKLSKWLGDPVMRFNPSDYGDPYTKLTCLYGEFDSFLEKTPVEPEGKREGQPNEWYSKVGGKSEKTKEHRSMTPPGFARAFFNANP